VKERQIRYVQVSTDEVYGDMPAGQSAVEADPLRPSSPYSAAKAAGDLWIPAYVRTFGINASITRGANTYGSHQYPEKLIPLFTTNALDGLPLPVYGDGRQRREWLHVADHCSGIDLVLREGKPGEVYNIGGQERENLDVVRRILELTGARPDLVRTVKDRPGHDKRYSIDATKLRGLGWAPKHSFEAGLAETVDWYRTHRAWWEPIKKKSKDFQEYYERQYAARLS
jgi:dTDP-glucose 4,6-dehydratase